MFKKNTVFDVVYQDIDPKIDAIGTGIVLTSVEALRWRVVGL